MSNAVQIESDSAAAPFDLNFVLPVRVLESARVRLTPFIPTVHAEEFIAGTKAFPELYKYFPSGPFDSVEELLDNLVEGRVQKDPNSVLFAIIDKTGEDGKHRVAGIVGLLNTSVPNLSTEIGYIVILPAFQRTHVASNAVGLLLHYCLDLPAIPDAADKTAPYGPGLGLRRVQWQANSENAKSVRTAERMGFRSEGIVRWQRVLANDKYGLAVPRTRDGAGPGRHSAVLAMCWDDWELEGGREHVRKQMDR